MPGHSDGDSHAGIFPMGLYGCKRRFGAFGGAVAIPATRSYGCVLWFANRRFRGLMSRTGPFIRHINETTI
jgi:hypothetical protein